jgi:hypothetical protein
MPLFHIPWTTPKCAEKENEVEKKRKLKVATPVEQPPCTENATFSPSE